MDGWMAGGTYLIIKNEEGRKKRVAAHQTVFILTGK
jgi:hypothetical protein